MATSKDNFYILLNEAIFSGSSGQTSTFQQGNDHTEGKDHLSDAADVSKKTKLGTSQKEQLS